MIIKNVEFKDVLNGLITERGVDIDHISINANISKAKLLKWIAGEGVPKVSDIIVLSKYFDVSINYLFGLND